MELSVGMFLAAVVCFTDLHPHAVVICERGPKRFRMAKEILLRQFGKDALATATEVSLSEKRAEAAEVRAGLVSQVAGAYWL